MVNFYQGVAGRRGYNPKGIVIHNDAGSNGANCAYYRNWLPTHNAEIGFAHYYVASDGIFQAENEANMAWHTANSVGNRDYIGIEACQSMGTLSQFLNNEERAIKLGAEILQRYGLQPTRTTVKLHSQFSPTACPHRSQEQHGAGVATQDYFIRKIQEYMNGSAKPSKPLSHDEAIAQSPAKTVNGYTAKLEKFNVQGNKFRSAGWMLPTSGGQPYRYGYVFLIDAKTGKEIARQATGAVSRPDVTKAYGVKGGTNYGMDVTFDVAKLKGKKFYAMFRRTNDKAGNTAGGYKDIDFKEFYFTL